MISSGCVVWCCVHELATNTVQHGAIAQPSGCVSVMWYVEAARMEDGDAGGSGRLVILRQESGVAMPGGGDPRAEITAPS